METRASGIPELGLDAGQKLLWHFLSSAEPRRPANASLAPVCQGRAFPGAVLSHAEELRAARGGQTLGLKGSLLSPGGTMAQQVPVQAIQVHQAPQQTSPSSDSSTDLTQTSSSGTGNGDLRLTTLSLTTAGTSPHQQSCSKPGITRSNSIPPFLTASQVDFPL